MLLCVQMCIVFNEAGLKEVEYPCLAQTFVNHNARLFKIFVMGRKQFIVERPSIKNFAAGGKYRLKLFLVYVVSRFIRIIIAGTSRQLIFRILAVFNTIADNIS